MIILFFVGALAGFRNIYLMARKVYKDKGKDDGKIKKRMWRFWSF